MKIIKKSLIFIFTILAFSLCLGSAKALKVGDSVRFNWVSGDDAARGLGVTVGGYRYPTWNYYATFNDGKEAKLYCIDPIRLNNRHGATIKVQEIFDFTNTKKSLKTRALYYGLQTILKEGAQSRNSSKAEITKTEIAVRVFANSFISGMFVKTGAGYVDDEMLSARSAVINLGVEIAKKNYEKVSTILNKCTTGSASKRKACLENAIKPSGIGSSTYKFPSTSFKNSVVKKIESAINAAYEFKTSGGVASTSTKVTASVYIAENENKERVSEEKIVNFRITDVKAGGYVSVGLGDVTCNKCSANGINIEKVEYLDNNTWKPLTNDKIDLAKFVDSNHNAKIKVTLKKNEIDAEECDATVTIKYRIYDPTNTVSVALLKETRGSHQKYIGAVPNFVTGVNGNGNNMNNGITQEFTIKSDVACIFVPCDSELATPACQEDTNGYVKAPTNIKRCIINNVDDAGNSYELNKNNGGVDNAYCSTFCKEDYRTINLNKAISDLKCGGYFQLRARIEGSQDCYRGTISGDKAINKTKFVDDIVEAQRTIINEYNKYLKATSAQKQSITSDSGVSRVTGTYTGIDVDKVNSDGTITTKSVTLNYEYRGNNADEVKKAIQADIDSAQKNLDQKNYDNSTAYGQYLSIINNLNACTVSWDNTYKFAQKVSWEYNEYINGSLQETYYGLVAAKDRYLSPVESTLTTNTSVQACTGTVDNEYNLCNGSANNWQSTDAVFSNYNFTVCSTEGCTTNTQSISNAKYVKQHIEKSQDYITPSVFYQIAGSGPASGGITTNNTYTGPNVQLTPVDGLPLSLDSVGGGIFKLSIEDLGEFYDTGELGRLIDFGGDNEEHSVAKTQNRTDASNWDGNYKCYYQNNCRIPECPTCDFECEGDFCEWKECPTCSVECVNCIYNLGELQLNFKPVSTSKFDSAGREYGYNWNISTTIGSLSLIKDKAEETIDRIEESNTTIYDDDESADSKLEFSIKLTPDVTNYIRDYNKKVENEEKGGYNDPSLTCYDYEDENNAVYKNMFCYSNFIDGLIEETNAEVYAKNRGEISNRTAESVLKSGYWEPWAGYQYNESVIGGPSWK